MNTFQKSLVLIAALVTATSVMARGFGNGPGRGHGGGYGGGYGQPDRGFRQQQIQLNLFDQQFKGQNTIFLKQEIKRQNPYLNLQELKIEAVKLVAKSKQGRGTATLVVGQMQSYAHTLQGSPYDFHSNEPFTYDRITIGAPATHQQQGVWQIKLQGNIKVKKVVVTVSTKEMFKQVRLRIADHYQGQNTIFLKRELNSQTNLNLQDYELQSVSMKAKSKMGRGMASLVVGNMQSMQTLVYGTPRDFHNDSDYTFQNVMIQNPAFGPSQGVWQIKLQGNIKVKDIVLTLKKK